MVTTLVNGKRVTEHHSERGFDAKSVRCPVCFTPRGNPCWGDGKNHVERARLARWLKMGLIEIADEVSN